MAITDETIQEILAKYHGSGDGDGLITALVSAGRRICRFLWLWQVVALRPLNRPLAT